MKHRAIFFVKDGVRIWYWVGSHDVYDTLLASASSHLPIKPQHCWAWQSSPTIYSQPSRVYDA